MKDHYYEWRDARIELQGVSTISPLKPTREEFVTMVESTISEINTKNLKNPFIAAAFQRCGQTPGTRKKALGAFISTLIRWPQTTPLESLVNRVAMDLNFSKHFHLKVLLI
jgi:hypothetical protein